MPLSSPTTKPVRRRLTRKWSRGIAPQLPLEAAIALDRDLGFEKIAKRPVATLRYIRASGGEPAGDERDVKSGNVAGSRSQDTGWASASLWRASTTCVRHTVRCGARLWLRLRRLCASRARGGMVVRRIAASRRLEHVGPQHPCKWNSNARRACRPTPPILPHRYGSAPTRARARPTCSPWRVLRLLLANTPQRILCLTVYEGGCSRKCRSACSTVSPAG